MRDVEREPARPARGRPPGKPAPPPAGAGISNRAMARMVQRTVVDDVGAPGARPPLDVGDSGDAVRLLQSKLAKVGVFDVAPTGYFGQVTLKSVKAFQSARAELLPATGGVGPLTWGALDAEAPTPTPTPSHDDPAPTPTPTPTPAPGTDPMPVTPGDLQAGFWLKLADGSAPSDAEKAALTAIVAARNTLGIHNHLADKVAYGKNKKAGYQYGGAGALAADASDDRLTKLAVAEFSQGEGHVSAVVTYDGTLSLGAGFADSMAQAWVRDWLDKDPSAEEQFQRAGMDVVKTKKGLQWQVVDDGGKVIVGEAARQFIRNSQRLLSLFVALTESSQHSGKARQAQVRAIANQVAKIPANLRKEMDDWEDAAVASTLHLMWWLPAGGPSGSPKRYLGSGGDGLKIAKAFAVGIGTTKAPAKNPEQFKPAGPRDTSAMIIGASVITGGVVSHYFNQFGLGAGKGGAGYLKRAVEAGATALNKSVDDALDDESLDDHVLLVGDGASGAPPARNKTVRLYDLGKWR